MQSVNANGEFLFHSSIKAHRCAVMQKRLAAAEVQTMVDH